MGRLAASARLAISAINYEYLHSKKTAADMLPIVVLMRAGTTYALWHGVQKSMLFCTVAQMAG
jgi:hypothetical protein